MQLLSFSLSIIFCLPVLTLSPHPAPSSSSPHSLLLCSPQSPPKGATIPYRPKPASTPVIFSGGQVRADPLGASTANLSLLLQHQPLPVSVAPGFTHFSSLPHSPHPPKSQLAWNPHCFYLFLNCHPSPPATWTRTEINCVQLIWVRGSIRWLTFYLVKTDAGASHWKYSA